MQSDQLCSIGADMTSATSLSLAIYNLLLYGMYLENEAAHVGDLGGLLLEALQEILGEDEVALLPPGKPESLSLCSRKITLTFLSMQMQNR